MLCTFEMQEVLRSGATSAPVLSCTPDICCSRKWSAIYFAIYEKHSIMCPAVHTVAKRMRLIVSGLTKLSSSFVFNAQISAFSVCSKKAFARLSNMLNRSFQSARNYLTLPRHDLQSKPKSPKLFLPHLLCLTQQARNIICHCLIGY